MMRKPMPLDESHITAVEQLHEALVRRAADEPFAFSAEPIPIEWLKMFPPDRLENLGNPAEVKETSTADYTNLLATRLMSTRFGRRVIVVAPLLEPVLGRGLGRDALSAIAHLRAHLTDIAAQVDIYLVLVAPPGSDSSEDWRAPARPVERNEHICRTFVWLTPADSFHWPKAMDAFFGRTFLALPFGTETGPSQDLDPLRNALEELTIGSIEGETPFSALQIAAWERILTSGRPGRGTAQKLVDALKPGTE
jgi:hypothetical protein